jgi:hypothetical protein
MGLRLFEVVERKEGGETRLELRGGNTRLSLYEDYADTTVNLDQVSSMLKTILSYRCE